MRKTADTDISAVKNAYRRYAPRYDVCFGAILNQGRRRVVERMNCRPGDLVLEVGVGTGLALRLYDRRVRVVGVDISPEMLRLALRARELDRLDNVIGLGEMDGEEMAFADDTFDKVAAMYVASVVPHPARLVDEMRRVCKPGGEIFIVNHFTNRNPAVAAMERLMAPLSRILGFQPDFPLDRFISETGLRVTEQSPVNLFGYWTLLRARNDGKPPSPTLPQPHPAATGKGDRRTI